MNIATKKKMAQDDVREATKAVHTAERNLRTAEAKLERAQAKLASIVERMEKAK